MIESLIALAHWIAAGAGWTPLLADAVVKATALLGAAWFVSLLFRRSSAAMRHLVWTVALVGSLALPLLRPIVPRWPVPLLPEAVVQAVPPIATSEVPARSPGSVQNGPATLGVDVTAAQAAASVSLSPAVMLMAVWVTVAAGLLLRLIFGMVRVRRLVFSSAEAAPWLQLARELAARSGVAQRVSFVQGTPDSMPLTWGFRKPVVLVPAGAETWPGVRLRTVLLHELAHVARYDCLTQAIAGAVCAIYWFNPLAWIAASRLVAERERACDDAVLADGADGPEYAEQLLDVARTPRPHGVLTWATVAMARRSQLEGRLLAILDPDLPRRVPTRAVAGAFALFLCVVVPPLAAIEPGPRASAPAGTELVPSGAGEDATLTMPRGGAQQGAVQSVTPGPKPQPRQTPKPTPEPATGGPERADEPRQAVDPKVVDALAAALKDTDAEVREHALMALAQLHDRRATAPLVAALGDSSADVREYAAVALGELRDPSAVAPLVTALSDKEAGVREQAASALGQLRDARAVEPLIAATRDANSDVREQAAFALSELRDPSSAPALAGLLSDKEADVREQAVFALGQLRSTSAVDGLIAALKDPSADVQGQAAFALGEIRDRKAVDALIAALGSASPDVREQAAFALGQIRDPRATDALMKAMKDADADVRKSAALALSQVVGGRDDKEK
jgi:HEAT repeat protein/beta-lactamase regulating signal transducer with metallopeptidase domain